VKKIKILLTFDYELPLGKASDYQRGLFDPADKLIQRANRMGVPIVLFTDICSAIKFREWDYNNYYLPFKNQVGQALREGHDAQLHIHPHWMTSTFAKGSFTPSNDYSLNNFKDEKKGLNIENVIAKAFDELMVLGREAKPDYSCVAFRAGGYDVEPESKRILTKLYELGVRLESSVIKDLYLDFNFSHIDYSNSPSSSQWMVSQEGPLTRAASSGLLELPISSRPVLWSDIIQRRVKKTLKKSVYRSRLYSNGGKGFLAMQGKQSMKSSWRKIFNPLVLSLDKEHMEVSDLESIVDYNVEKYGEEDHDLVLTVIGHPKSMGEYHLNLMEGFVNSMRKKFKDNVSFITYRDIHPF
jgi:hypothetical protein